VTTNGILTTLVSFAGTNGWAPRAPLTLGNDGNFYGTTSSGGSINMGSVFCVTTNGVLTTLASFAGTNGANPLARLTLGSEGNLYGTTMNGGNYGGGTVFCVTTNGTLTDVYDFELAGGVFHQWPVVPSPLTSGSDGNFYGTTGQGGSGGGTVFRLTTNGVLTTLYSFIGPNGTTPQGGLTLGSDGNFYGTTYGGGAYTNQNGQSLGTVFQVTTNCVLTTLVSFALTNGAGPLTGLTMASDGNFYGTAESGGTGYGGAIYRLRHGVSIQSVGMRTNGFQLNTLNVGGSGWVVLESSSDLVNWTRIQTNGTAAAQQFLDSSALSQPQQFYSVKPQ
jgi:uncharacterized repeat protein (TIGR03803 family)